MADLDRIEQLEDRVTYWRNRARRAEGKLADQEERCLAAFEDDEPVPDYPDWDGSLRTTVSGA